MDSRADEGGGVVMEFRDKVVIITGSSSGIGQAIAIRFAKEGAKVVINYKENKEGAEETLKQILNTGGEAIIVQADVSVENEANKLVTETVSHFGKLDVLINNAGRYIDGDEWNGTSEIWEKTLKHCLLSVMNVSKYAIEQFQKQKSGIIVSTSSRYSVAGQFDALAYSVSKAGIANLTQSYAKLLAPFGRANCISPGAVKTGYWLRAPQHELDEQYEIIPLKDLASLEDIVEGILFLATDKSKMMTGQNLIIDGGSTLR